MDHTTGGAARPAPGRGDRDIFRALAPADRGSAAAAASGVPVTAVPHITVPLDVRHRRAALVAIVLLAAVLRLNYVTQPLIDAFSWRQASTAMMADNFYRTNWNILLPEVSWTGPGPNYQGREFQTFSHLTALLYTVFGQHESIGRALAAAFGTWGVFASYLLVRRVWDERRALGTALALAILPGAIFIDRSFLPDPAMLSLTITALWLVVRAIQTGRRTDLVVAAFFTTLAFLTKLPGIVALAPMIYAAAVSLRPEPRQTRRRRATQLTLALVLALLPVVAYYWWAVHLGRSYPPYHIAGAANWVWKSGLEEWLERNYYLDSFLHHLTSWLWTAPVLGLVLIGCVVPPPAVRDRTPGKDAAPEPPPPALRWFFHYWLLGCAVFYLLGARELSENVWNLHVFNLFAAAMAGHALVLVASMPAAVARVGGDRSSSHRGVHPLLKAFVGAGAGEEGVWRVAALTVIIVAFGQYRLADFYEPRQGRDSYLLGLELRARSQPGDLVVTMAEDVGDPIAIYYSRRRGWVFPPAHMPEVWRPWNLIPPDPKRSIRMFEDLRARGARWLGIVAAPKDDTPRRRDFWQDHPEVVKHFNRTCEFMAKNDHWVIYRILTPAELAQRDADRDADRRRPPSTVPATSPTIAPDQPVQ